MKRRVISSFVVVVMLVGSLAGCGKSASTSAGTNAVTTETAKATGGTLNVLTWEGDVADDAVKGFEKEYGVKVNITNVEDTNTILAKMLQGNSEYDVIDLESAYVKSFVDANLLAPLDEKALKNKGNINEKFLQKGAVGDEKYKYTLPLCGPLYTGVVINKKTCPIEIKSFADLANPALKGKIWSTNATISLYAGALQSLGYSPNSSDKGELDKAQELLQKIKPNIKAFGASSVSPMETGDCAVAYTYDYNILMSDNKENWDKFEIIPATTLGYTQYWSIAKTSKNQELANEFINYTYGKDSAVALANQWGGVPVVKEDLIKAEVDSDYFKNPIMKEFEDMWPSHVDLAVSDKQTELMDTLYNQLMSGQ